MRWLAVLVLCLVAACATRPSELVPGPEPIVIVKTAQLPAGEPWISLWADHAWIDLRVDGAWKRVEIRSRRSGVRVEELDPEAAFADERWGRGVHVVTTYRGAEAERIGLAILAEAMRYPRREDYRAFPGPNSNTFVVWLSRRIPGFALELYPTALGKDYPGWFHAGVSTTRTGVQLDTAIVGAQVGLKEGVELHLLGLTIGVGLWPPQLKLPFLRGIPFGW